MFEIPLQMTECIVAFIRVVEGYGEFVNTGFSKPQVPFLIQNAAVGGDDKYSYRVFGTHGAHNIIKILAKHWFAARNLDYRGLEYGHPFGEFLRPETRFLDIVSKIAMFTVRIAVIGDLE